jgi:hypothetical protein
MMRIDIDDSVIGKSRRRLLMIQSTIYALENTPSKLEAAKFLGITERALRNRLINYEELADYRAMLPRFLRDKDPDYLKNYFEKNVKFFDAKTRKQYEVYLNGRWGVRSNPDGVECDGQDNRSDADL